VRKNASSPIAMQVSHVAHVKLTCSVRFVVHADPSEVKGGW